MKLLLLLCISLHWGGKKATNTVHHTFCIYCEGLLIPWCASVSSMHFSRSSGYTARGKQDPLMELILSLYGTLLTLVEATYVDCIVYCSISVVRISLTIY